VATVFATLFALILLVRKYRRTGFLRGDCFALALLFLGPILGFGVANIAAMDLGLTLTIGAAIGAILSLALFTVVNFDDVDALFDFVFGGRLWHLTLQSLRKKARK